MRHADIGEPGCRHGLPSASIGGKLGSLEHFVNKVRAPRGPSAMWLTNARKKKSWAHEPADKTVTGVLAMGCGRAGRPICAFDQKVRKKRQTGPSSTSLPRFRSRGPGKHG